MHHACVDYNNDSFSFYLPFRDTSNPDSLTTFNIFEQVFTLEYDPDMKMPYSLEPIENSDRKSTVAFPRCDFIQRNQMAISLRDELHTITNIPGYTILGEYRNVFDHGKQFFRSLRSPDPHISQEDQYNQQDILPSLENNT